MRVLLTGKSGQVGTALASALSPLGEVSALTRKELDLADLPSLRRTIREQKPETIVNAAAYTAVDRAESERASAFAVNATAVGVLAEEAKKLGALLVHFSTDYVFDGEKATPYAEDDSPAPINVYGESKLAGERAVAASGCRHLIFRTSWVYSARGRNFLRAILAAAREGKALRVVNDQRGAPTPAHFIADAVLRVLQRSGEGLYHLSAAGEATWHEFAREILAAAHLSARVVAVPSSEYRTVAARPKNSLLDNARLRQVFGIALPDWRMGLRDVSSRIDA